MKKLFLLIVTLIVGTATGCIETNTDKCPCCEHKKHHKKQVPDECKKDKPNGGFDLHIDTHNNPKEEVK